MRHISPDVFSDEFIGRLAAELRLLWIGLLARIADDQGRAVDNPALIAAAIFPYDQHITAEIVDIGLSVFAEHGKILRYAAGTNGDGRRLIQIVKWWQYQDGAQWAARSTYPAPDGWIDRIRAHLPGQGTTPVKVNWDTPGGFGLKDYAKLRRLHDAATKPLRSAYVTASKPLRSREDEDEDEDEDERRKNPPPHSPPNKQGGRAGSHKEQSPDRIQLTHEQKKHAEQIKKILGAAAFGDRQQGDTLSVLVATRISTYGPIHLTLAAFASAFADDRALDKAAIATHRLEVNKVPPAFMDPKTWRSLPPEILAAAGIRDLQQYIATEQVRKFERG